MRAALKVASELYLATDEDREGEAISWHLLEYLKPKVPVKRMVFHEITADAIANAVANPRGIDYGLVDAAETRRVGVQEPGDSDFLPGERVDLRVFTEINPGFPDGFRIDVDGRIWCSSGDGVQVFAPDGTRLGKIRVPEHVSNLCFGGLKKNRLFITATTSMYALYVAVTGL